MTTYTELSNIKLSFYQIFEACSKLIVKPLWSKLTDTYSTSKVSRKDVSNVHNMRSITIILVGTPLEDKKWRDVIKKTKPLYCESDHCSSFRWKFLCKQQKALEFQKK